MTMDFSTVCYICLINIRSVAVAGQTFYIPGIHPFNKCCVWNLVFSPRFANANSYSLQMGMFFIFRELLFGNTIFCCQAISITHANHNFSIGQDTCENFTRLDLRAQIVFGNPQCFGSL